ncbi:unnamed protein product [Notodromas monacha]|uniref:Uncharacterized protein n=1 Tax=Notodromas monacha TaxID=399045 RepID=A0A7R9BBZ7_9CRUS|nr:unnamed protein product [Notodromas monacha]CAG0912507.1 unnamed protein product [Notodromas monacha]
MAASSFIILLLCVPSALSLDPDIAALRKFYEIWEAVEVCLDPLKEAAKFARESVLSDSDNSKRASDEMFKDFNQESKALANSVVNDLLQQITAVKEYTTEISLPEEHSAIETNQLPKDQDPSKENTVQIPQDQVPKPKVDIELTPMSNNHIPTPAVSFEESTESWQTDVGKSQVPIGEENGKSESPAILPASHVKPSDLGTQISFPGASAEMNSVLKPKTTKEYLDNIFPLAPENPLDKGPISQGERPRRHETAVKTEISLTPSLAGFSVDLMDFSQQDFSHGSQPYEEEIRECHGTENSGTTSVFKNQVITTCISQQSSTASLRREQLTKAWKESTEKRKAGFSKDGECKENNTQIKEDMHLFQHFCEAAYKEIEGNLKCCSMNEIALQATARTDEHPDEQKEDHSLSAKSGGDLTEMPGISAGRQEGQLTGSLDQGHLWWPPVHQRDILADYLPTEGKFPVKIKSTESSCLELLNCTVDESSPGFNRAHHGSIFAAHRITPTSNTGQNFDSFVTKSLQVFIEAFAVVPDVVVPKERKINKE